MQIDLVMEFHSSSKVLLSSSHFCLLSAVFRATGSFELVIDLLSLVSKFLKCTELKSYIYI